MAKKDKTKAKAKATSETKEVGEVREIGSEEGEVDFLYHTSRNPAQEALMIKDLREKEMTQGEIAEKMGISQGQVSKRLNLLELPDKLFQRVLDGELRPSTAYELSKLPDNIQAQYVNEEKVTLEAVKKMGKALKEENLAKILNGEEVWEDHSKTCPTCGGTGRVASTKEVSK